jgi:protein FrlC
MSSAPAPRYGFRTAGYRNRSLQEAFESLAGVGYRGVEICLEHPEARPETMTVASAETLAGLARDAGLEVASVSYHADAEPEEPRSENQLRAVGLTRPLGAEVLILNARKARPGGEQAQWDGLRRTLEGLLPRAEAEGVTLALEPEPGHFLNSSADMGRLLAEVSHPNLGVNLDVGHAFVTDEDVTESIRSLGSSIVHTHLEGMPAGVHRHLIPGEGDLDLVAVHRALQEIGYRGYYTVDLFDIADDPEGAARRSLEALRRLLG